MPNWLVKFAAICLLNQVGVGSGVSAAARSTSAQVIAITW
jgi:hypothetical protein